MSTRLEFATESEAQAFADKVHAQMIALDPVYADSVAKGHTTAWAIPYQLSGSKAWCVNVKDRCLKTLTTTEKTKLKPIVKGELVEPPKAKVPVVEVVKPK